MWQVTMLMNDRVSEILSRLFSLIMQSQASSNIIDLEETDLVEAQKPKALQCPAHWLPNNRNLTILPKNANDRASNEMTNIKKEPSRCELRQQDLRRKRTLNESEDQRWRFDTPPPSGMTSGSRTRWPPQYLSPPPTPQPKRHRPSIPKTEDATPTIAYPATSRSSSLEVVWTGTDSSPIATRQSTRHAKRATYAHMFLPKEKKAATKKKATRCPPVADPSKKPSEKGKPSMPPSFVVNPREVAKNNSPSGSSARTISPPLSPESGKMNTKNVIFHFFLSDERLGAVPITFSQCNTCTQFFDQAKAAWSFLDADDGQTQLAGVSVTFGGLGWPLIVPWKNAAGYKRMMESIETTKATSTRDMLVKVQCIKK